MRHLWLGWASLAALLLAACSSDDPGAKGAGIVGSDAGAEAQSDAGDPVAAITDACAYVASQDCGMAESCSTGYFRMGGHDVASCTTELTKYCVDGALAEGSTRTPDEIRSCMADRWGSCQKFLRAQAGKFLGDICPGKGTLATGKPCLFGSQCETGTCIGAYPDRCGTCGDPPVEHEGCQFNALPCAPGLLCNGTTCEVPHDEGAPCDTVHPCYADLGCESGICVESKAVGDACSCQHNQLVNCAEGCTCNPNTDKCTPFVDNVAKGGACGQLADGTLAACAAPMQCRLPNPPTNAPGTCADPIPVGGPLDNQYVWAFPANGCIGYARPTGADPAHAICQAMDGTKLVCPPPGYPP